MLPSGDYKIILGDDAVLVAGRDVQCAAAVDGQIGAAEDDAVHIAVFVRQNITLPVGQGILAAFREGQENLIGLPDEEGACSSQ